MPTGHGAIGTNGIYKYGELDSAPLWSDLENLGMQSVSDVVDMIIGRDIVQLLTPTGIPDSVYTDLVCDTTVMNTCPGITPTLFTTGFFTCTVAGTYLFEGVVEFAANSTGARYIRSLKSLAANPTLFTARRLSIVPATSGAQVQAVSVKDTVVLAVGDCVKFQIEQSSGATRNATFAQVTVQKLA